MPADCQTGQQSRLYQESCLSNPALEGFCADNGQSMMTAFFFFSIAVAGWEAVYISSSEFLIAGMSLCVPYVPLFLVIHLPTNV
ncbi:hypothetical protein L873DRAFT_1798305 [Choiromyces venosus 120613-1]|uniref:Uncharacterized protein n=1 Tax=Choiromyces venosus 120613-1 TaxID=1336337 RepID=A0A3N4K4K5_9PEZI|nr:hypothetical protein L873DRAFT_1798305 [Choiromyces venosus 120613-1]